MCPDRDLVSAYVDGEVPSPWKERLEEHFASCPDCAALVGRYGELGEALRVDSSEAAVLAAAQERGRARLEGLLAARPAAVPGPRRVAIPRAWGRSISLPIPVAAAAALLVLLLGGTTAALAFRPGANGSAVQAAVASGEIAPSAQAQAQPASMNDLLRYLDSSDGQITLTINLPSGATFGSAGKPVIMRQGQVLRGQTVSDTTAGGVAP